jgi:hypothetical protein
LLQQRKMPRGISACRAAAMALLLVLWAQAAIAWPAFTGVNAILRHTVAHVPTEKHVFLRLRHLFSDEPAPAMPLHKLVHVPPRESSFFTPLDARLRSLGHTGSTMRLRAALQRALDGKQITVGLIGGSIAEGAGSYQVGNKSISGWLDAYFKATFPKAPPRLVNGAVGATTTGYMAACASHHVPQDADVVITEYAFNNLNTAIEESPFDKPLTRSYERLVRWLLRLPHAPAVVLLNVFNFEHSRPFRGAYWGGSTERDTNELSFFYDLPSLSIKGCCYHFMAANARGFRVDGEVRKLHEGATLAERSDYFFWDSECGLVCCLKSCFWLSLAAR